MKTSEIVMKKIELKTLKAMVITSFESIQELGEMVQDIIQTCEVMITLDGDPEMIISGLNHAITIQNSIRTLSRNSFHLTHSIDGEKITLDENLGESFEEIDEIFDEIYINARLFEMKIHALTEKIEEMEKNEKNIFENVEERGG